MEASIGETDSLGWFSKFLDSVGSANIGQTNPSLSTTVWWAQSQAGPPWFPQSPTQTQIQIYKSNTNTNTNMYDELDLRAVLWGSHQVTLVTALEKAEIPSHHRLTAVFELLVVSPFSKVHNSKNNNRKLSICLISIWRSSELLVVSAFVCTVCIACISNTNSIKPSQGPYYNLFYCGLQHGWIFGKLISLSKSYIANFLFI